MTNILCKHKVLNCLVAVLVSNCCQIYFILVVPLSTTWTPAKASFKASSMKSFGNRVRYCFTWKTPLCPWRQTSFAVLTLPNQASPLIPCSVHWSSSGTVLSINLSVQLAVAPMVLFNLDVFMPFSMLDIHIEHHTIYRACSCLELSSHATIHLIRVQ
jgi:hypothetical protein